MLYYLTMLCFSFVSGNFEAAMWAAAREIFPQVASRGCLFHRNQALYRKIQDLGLQAAYQKRQETHKFCRKLMAFPFLSPEWIPRIFEHILSVNGVTEQLEELLAYYMDTQWIRNSTFPLSSWSVYQRQYRTNNDVEGWHNRLNHKAM